MDNSCIGCKYLYKRDSGYSNYTVAETVVDCAVDRNPHLPADEPYNWTTGGGDQWPATNQSRCERYEAGPTVHLDVDGEVGPADCTDDEILIALICKKEAVDPNGRPQ